MPQRKLTIGDAVMVGEPPNVEEFVLASEQDSGGYATLEDQHGNQHTGWTWGRWCIPVPISPHPIECEHTCRACGAHINQACIGKHPECPRHIETKPKRDIIGDHLCGSGWKDSEGDSE